MSGSNAAPFLGPEMRAVRRELAGASDQRVLDVLRFVDSLNDRSQANGLLAPLRDRLRALRPRRPLRFPRLLFEPVGPAIVDPGDWRATLPAMPRSAIPSFAGIVRRGLPDITAEVERVIADSDTPEALRVCEAGHALWAPAADVLQAAALPADWKDTSLPPSAFASLVNSVGGVLQVAWKLVELADPSVPEAEVNETLSALLAAAEGSGALPWGMLLTVLLQRFPTSEAPRRAGAAMRADKTMRDAATAAIEAAWTWIEAGTRDLGLGDPADAADVVRRQVKLLEELARDPANRKRTTELQASLRDACAARFQSGVNQRLLAPLASLSAQEAADGGVLAMLEADARGLRRLDMDSRRLGCGAAHDARLAEAAAAIAKRIDIPTVDRARLIEILRGPQAAVDVI